MILIEYQTMLLGAEINVFTDHRNLTFKNFVTQRVLRWRCHIEEYPPKIFYLEGKNNVLADAFSRLPWFDDPKDIEGKGATSLAPPDLLDAYHAIQEVELYECLRYLPEMDDFYEICESYLNLPSSEENPLSMKWLRETQQGDTGLITRADEDGNRYFWRDFEGVKLVCHAEAGKEDTHLKICLANEALKPAIHWFHLLLNHPGRDKLLQGMTRFYQPDLWKQVAAYKCDACQRRRIRWTWHGSFCT